MEGHERSLVDELLSQWDVDIALRRPGRFDTTVFIPNPDLAAMKKIFELSLKGRPCNVDVSKLALMTEGYASAEVVDICDKAAKIPLRGAISESKSVLSSWYPKAIRELANTEEVEIFEDLIKRGVEKTQSLQG